MQISLVTHRIIETFINPKCTLVCQTISHPSIHWHYQHTHTHKQNGDHLTSQIHQTLKKKRRTYSRCLVDTLSNDIFMQMKPYDDFCCCTLMFPLPSGFLLFIFSLLLLVCSVATFFCRFGNAYKPFFYCCCVIEQLDMHLVIIVLFLSVWS